MSYDICSHCGKPSFRCECGIRKPLEDMTEPELRSLMTRCGDALKTVLGAKTQFALVVFDDPKVAQYISSCTRDTMILAMRETADRLERRQDVPR